MPRGAHHICHDALNPRCVKCCPCGGAAHRRRLALKLACLFPLSFSPCGRRWRIAPDEGACSWQFICLARHTAINMTALKPPYADCWRSGGAAKKLAGVLGQSLVLLFPFFVWIRSIGGGGVYMSRGSHRSARKKSRCRGRERSDQRRRVKTTSTATNTYRHPGENRGPSFLPAARSWQFICLAGRTDKTMT